MIYPQVKSIDKKYNYNHNNLKQHFFALLKKKTKTYKQHKSIVKCLGYGFRLSYSFLTYYTSDYAVFYLPGCHFLIIENEDNN